jgi:elongation factor G
VLSDFDDTIADKFLSGEEITTQELRKSIRNSTQKGFIPVLCGSAFKNKGVQPLLDAIVEYLPSPLDRGEITGHSLKDKEKTESRLPSETELFSAIAFKIATDPFVGSVTYIRIYSGKLESGQTVYNSLKKKRERINKIFQMHADKRTEVQIACAGDIVAIAGFKETVTGETLCTENKPIVFDLMEFPESVISVAIEPKTTNDEKKLITTLEQLRLEDPSFSYTNNQETGQLLIKGMGELHLEIIADRLQREFNVGVRVGKPQVAYRESISTQSIAEHLFSKEISGKTQFGHTQISVEPIEEQTIVVELKLPNRKLPHEILDSIEKAIKDTAPGGIVAGYPAIGIRASVVEAKFNEDEASSVAYSIAASMAFKEACINAAPVLMEPLMELEISTPQEYTGDVISDINSKRGKIINMGLKQNKDLIHAEVPLSELFGYSTDLRSRSQGRASFSMKFKKYEAMQQSIAKALLEKKGIYI